MKASLTKYSEQNSNKKKSENMLDELNDSSINNIEVSEQQKKNIQSYLGQKFNQL